MNTTIKKNRRSAPSKPPTDVGPPPQAALPTIQPAAKPTCGEVLTALMRQEGGVSAAELAASVGWQVHSVRGFISGTLKKRAELQVRSVSQDGVTRYCVSDRVETAA